MTEQHDDASTMDWVRTTPTTNSTCDIGENGTNHHSHHDEDEGGSARKRARTTSFDSKIDLPVVGYHVVLVGPRHLTQPLATTLLQVSGTFDPLNGVAAPSPWLTSDADILAVQALQRCIAYQNLDGGSSSIRDSFSSCPTQQRYVHILERLDADRGENRLDGIPKPCHVVLMAESTAQAFSRGPIHELSSVQAALQNLIPPESTSRYGVPEDWLRQQSFSLVVCLSPAAHDAPYNPCTNDNTLDYGKWLLQKSGMAVFICLHPHLESSRRTVARFLWQRCRQSQRGGGLTAMNHTGPAISPLAVACLSTR